MLVPENLEVLSIGMNISLMQGTTELKRLWDYLRGASASTFVCVGSLYTENELVK